MNYDSATDLSRMIANKTLSCHELMQCTLDRIDSTNPEKNAIVAMADKDTLLQQAQMADNALAQGEYRGWMHGLPHAVKDLADIKGFVTSCGSPLLATNLPDQDSLFAARIREAGAIFIGKTNVPEVGLGSQSYNTLHGSTKNAFNTALCAGGSSGGAAVALAMDMLPVADGSDMMGSLRNPAAYNNVVGFRPGIGRVPRTGGDIFFGQLSTEGPMGRCVEDVINLLLTMAGADIRAPLSWREELGNLTDFKPVSLKNIHIGWLGDFDNYLATETGLLDTCEAKLKALGTVGSTISNCDLAFDMASLWQCWLTLRHWFLAHSADPLFKNPVTRAQLKPEVQWELAQAKHVTTESLGSACDVRANWYRTLVSAFEKYDFLALPSAQVFPFDVEQHWPTEIEGHGMDTYHRWMEVTIGGTLSGCPVISLPAGFDQNNRPMGIQFIGPIGEDKKLLEFALAYEQALPWQADYARIEHQS